MRGKKYKRPEYPKYIEIFRMYNEMPGRSQKRVDQMCYEAGGVCAEDLKRFLITGAWEGYWSENTKRLAIEKFIKLCDRYIEENL